MPLKFGHLHKLREWPIEDDHLAMGLATVLVEDFEVSSLVMLYFNTFSEMS